jgi:hypothetical protein
VVLADMKYVFPILFLLFATQSLGHGEHFTTDGVVFYLDNESGSVVLDETALAELREIIQEGPQKKDDGNGYRKLTLKDRGFAVAKPSETIGKLPLGQIFLVVDDTRLGALKLPLHPVYPYASHSHIKNHSSSKMTERAYFAIPKSALRHASSFEIRRAVAGASSELIKKIEFGG